MILISVVTTVNKMVDTISSQYIEAFVEVGIDLDLIWIIRTIEKNMVFDSEKIGFGVLSDEEVLQKAFGEELITQKDYEDFLMLKLLGVNC